MSWLLGSGAARAGLQPGDLIVEIAGLPTPYFHQLQQALEAHAGQHVSLKYARGTATHEVQAAIDATGKLGFQPAMRLTYQTQRYSLAQAISIGSFRAFDILRVNLIGLFKVLTGQVSASKSLSGPIGIAQIFGQQLSWGHFWHIIGLLSMVLALTNLLPIPALDGGHVLFLLYEMITGRQLSERFLATAQKIGMVILLLLISYATINDIYKLLQKLR
ncbi:MAG: M50 family metallopeptidase [Bacteroidota bacterium]